MGLKQHPRLPLNLGAKTGQKVIHHFKRALLRERSTERNLPLALLRKLRPGVLQSAESGRQTDRLAGIWYVLSYLDAKKLTFKDFKMIKSALPKPRLFNIDFIFTQQQKLNEFRNQLRQLPKDVTYVIKKAPTCIRHRTHSRPLSHRLTPHLRALTQRLHPRHLQIKPVHDKVHPPITRHPKGPGHQHLHPLSVIHQTHLVEHRLLIDDHSYQTFIVQTLTSRKVQIIQRFNIETETIRKARFRQQFVTRVWMDRQHDQHLVHGFKAYHGQVPPKRHKYDQYLFIICIDQ